MLANHASDKGRVSVQVSRDLFRESHAGLGFHAGFRVTTIDSLLFRLQVVNNEATATESVYDHVQR
jgi:hypothetical protein